MRGIGRATLTVFCSRINVSFIDKEGERHDFQVAEGDNLLDIAQANDLEMEGESITCGLEG